MFKKLFNRVPVKVLVTNFIDGDEVRQVYDVGNGAFIYDYFGDTPRYLKADGTFQHPTQKRCNGDPVSWVKHIGDVSILKYTSN